MKVTKDELIQLVVEDLKKSGQTVDEKKVAEMVSSQMEEIGKIIDAKLAEYQKVADKKVVIDPEKEGGKGQWKSFGEQLQAVANVEINHKVDERLVKAASGLSEAVDAEGGFLVAPEYVAGLIKSTHETGVLIKDCRVIPITSNRLILNALKEISRANGSRWGGILAYWANEAGEKTKSKPEFRQIDLKLNKLIGLCYATDELLQDATALESVIKQGFAEEFGFKIDDAIVNGTGAGMPLGLLNCPALVSQAKETGQVAATIIAENIDKMWNRMPAKLRIKAKWYINQDVEPEFPKMHYTAGTGGFAAFVPPKDLGSKAPSGTLKGRPIVPIEQAAALGTVGDIILANLSEYLLIEKGPMEAASSIHVRFVHDETTFRFVYRIDGQPVWNSALTAYKGSTTRSPYVALATRS